MTFPSLDQLRRDATRLKKAWDVGELQARQRIANNPPRQDLDGLKHADFLHVVARENAFESWPKLVWAAETIGLDRAARLQRLKIALANGQNWVVGQLLAETPDLAKDQFGLCCALYDLSEVKQWLDDDPEAATREFGPKRPICHLAFSSYIHARPDLQNDMIAIAEMLLAHGADVNDSIQVAPDNDHRLSALYGAIGHANNMEMGRWLLEHGADPNDGESLYHATELGHHDGLKMLLEHGANPRGTNALLRAMDFHDHTAVELLLQHGAQADDFDGTHIGGEAPWVVPALHQAARRMCDKRMVDLLLDNGADPGRKFEGTSAYAHARVFGNRDVVSAIEARGAVPDLSPNEMLLARAAEGLDNSGVFVDTATLPDAYRNIVRLILHLPGKLAHIRALVALGVEYDRPDSEGLTPVQLAGWEGLPEVLEYFLQLKPDLGHVNGYGGTLLSTIIHGSENCPERETRDYLACLQLTLDQGVALPRTQLAHVGREDVAGFLQDWASRHPGQVV
ncbi:MAG: hypothetical protein ABJD13_00305 [Paracoccaceae bacterium]